jgi:hypothetical protein
MVDADNQKFMLCASCQPSDKEETERFGDLGLVTGHAYGVLEVFDIEHEG